MKNKNTKRSLLLNALSLLMCVTMLIGSTFAWFTDSVTSAGNVIKSGKLDVTMEWKDATTTGAQTTYKDASEGAIFDNDLWEPGYVEAKNIKISNVGTLALKYNLNIAANGEVSELADVIDVYFAEGEYTLASREMTELTKVGTLTEVLAGMPANMTGDLLAETSDVVTIALKMQETAGNEYQELAIGSDFSVVLMATQDTVEKDSFDETYDETEIPTMDIRTIDGVTYGIANDGNYYMISVDDYTLTEFTVDEKVTVLGTGNGVNDNDRVFGKNAPLTSLTLPEGLVEIKDNALNALPNLTSVNFPSMLKTIGIQAFRITGMTELAIPKNVETIKEGAFRDMANLTTVTVEGNVSFDNYAFRSCPNLTSIYLLGDDVQFAGSQFATHSDNGDANGITIYVKNATVAARVIAAQTSAYGYEVKILDEEVKVTGVSNATELTNAIEETSATEDNLIVLKSGTYANDINLTADALGNRGDIIFKAESGATFTGTVTLGYRDQGTASAMFNSNVTFDGITFDHAGNDKHSLDVQDVKSLTLTNCTIIGDGEYGIGSSRGNACGPSKIINCTFENAKMQILGNFGTGLVVDGCEFKNSGLNVQAGNGVTVQNCNFDSKITTANVGDSFYLVRSNSTPITVKNCEVAIDSDLTEVATNQAKWGVFWNRGTTNWTVSDVKVSLTDSAVAQSELLVVKTTSTGAINCTNVTVNGVLQ